LPSTFYIMPAQSPYAEILIQQNLPLMRGYMAMSQSKWIKQVILSLDACLALRFLIDRGLLQ